MRCLTWEGFKMDKKLNCRDFGSNCDYSVCASSEREVLQKVGEHIQTIHAMGGFSRDFYRKALAAIHDGSCSEEESSGQSLCDACSEVCMC